MTARPKTDYVRSNKILRACRLLACQHCGARDGTVVAAHSNQAIHGKCLSKKSSDIFVAALCHTHHMMIDQGKDLTEEERFKLWDVAHVRTLRELVLCGLWPSDIELPSYV